MKSLTFSSGFDNPWLRTLRNLVQPRICRVLEEPAKGGGYRYIGMLDTGYSKSLCTVHGRSLSRAIFMNLTLREAAATVQLLVERAADGEIVSDLTPPPKQPPAQPVRVVSR